MHYLKQSQRDVKKNNLNLILNTIIKHEPLSRADIVRITKISKPTVSNLIDYLLQRVIINEIGIGKSKGGRKPILIRFNNLRKYIVATDLGREDCTVAISDLKGNILEKAYEKFKKEDRLNDKLKIAKDLIHLLINSLKIEPSLIFKISCIAPGVYAERGKELKWSPVNTQNEGADIKNYFESEYHVPVIINHSTKLSLLGEKVAGKAKGYKNVLYIDFAYGLGCSFMIDSNIYFGVNNSAGEFGYFYSSLQEFMNNTVKPYEFGCLEKRISGYALQNKGLEKVKENPQSRILQLAQGDQDKITGRTVFQAAMEGDQEATQILKSSFDYFNMALANIINLLTPEIVIFGGGFSNAGDYLLDLINDGIKDKVLYMPKFEISELKKDASIVGAIHYLLNNTDLLEEI
ncbi:ROK family transcriptional regulator [Atribacter laminatus]|uniref:N-acetylglucosamine repressor n=1 Tax=Atribacter laminatus TaxID=2847778 RepID=A0A7T1ANC8_ATRLM|nr:ROK family transcriptional regulator [Atribacter laminatus]QPM69095.1 N-acetylglucosamine repressor [Atribacter laminatus]